MGNRDRVREYIESISPNRATIRDIVTTTGIQPHAQVYQLVQALLKRKIVNGAQVGHVWQFWALGAEENSDHHDMETTQESDLESVAGIGEPVGFEQMASEVLGGFFGVDL